MKSSAFYAVIGIGAILVICIIWWGASSHVAKPSPTSTTTSTAATSTPPLTGMEIYTNGEYGFSIFYPQRYQATTTFTSFYHLPNTWRLGALPNVDGTPILSIVGHRIENAASYPRYFDAEVRIGANKDAKEVAACAKVGDGELPKTPVTINGTEWSVFATQDAGMMQYAKSVSYRTVHNHTCFALEQIETGSSYRDDSASPIDIPDAQLDAYYADLAPIIQSFSFSDI